MLSRVERTIREHNLLSPGERWLCALSGGPDSMALLGALRILSSRLSLSLHAGVIDHGLRPESAEEAKAVAARCVAMQIPCTVVRLDLSAPLRPHHSLQETAREARLSALLQLADAQACAKVALGHQANDQAETVLFRILRGTGPKGLSGIPYARDRLVRPLLDVWRSEILSFLTKHRIPYFEDPSNQNPRFARARIRHEILPYLARENPKVLESLYWLAKAAQAGACPSPVPPDLPADLYLSRRNSQRLTEMLRVGQGTQYLSVQGGKLEVRYGEVVLSPSPSHQRNGEAASEEFVEMPSPNSVDNVSGRRLAVAWEVDGSRDPTAIYFDADALSWPLTIRCPRPGDRMKPRGGIGLKKLSDLFIDAKVPRTQRPFLPVLCDGSGEILYVPHLRPSEFGRPSDRTSRLIRVKEPR